MFYSKENVRKFFELVLPADYSSLTKERANEIDMLVDKWKYYFTNKSYGTLDLINFTAEKMRVSHKFYGINTPEEMGYFFIMMIDPLFYALESYEAGNTILEQKELMKKNINIYSRAFVVLERKINNSLKFYNQDEMCYLDRIQR